MKLRQLIDIANDAYPDDRIEMAHRVREGRAEKEDVGDGLALFIESELVETFDPGSNDKYQLGEAVRVMRTARDELLAVYDALSDRLAE